MKTHLSRLRSISQPKNTGASAAPTNMPVVTQPKTVPTAPAGAMARTIMSREGRIAPCARPTSAKAATTPAIGRDSRPMSTRTAAARQKPATRTKSWRRVRSASQPPRSTPRALAIRSAVNAVLAAVSPTPCRLTSAVTVKPLRPPEATPAMTM